MQLLHRCVYMCLHLNHPQHSIFPAYSSLWLASEFDSLDFSRWRCKHSPWSNPWNCPLQSPPRIRRDSNNSTSGPGITICTHFSRAGHVEQDRLNFLLTFNQQNHLPSADLSDFPGGSPCEGTCRRICMVGSCHMQWCVSSSSANTGGLKRNLPPWVIVPLVWEIQHLRIVTYCYKNLF